MDKIGRNLMERTYPHKPMSPAFSRSFRSYEESHQAPGKGESYETYYSSDPEMQYLWRQECRVLERVLEEYFRGQPPHLLDFACGTGRIASFLESRVASSYAVDISDSMLDIARKKLTRTNLFKVNLIKERPFPEKSFNLITAFRFFLNAEPELRLAALRALEPLLAEGGCFVFNIHQNLHSLYYWPSHLYARIRHIPPDVTLSIGECDAILRQVGLRIERVYPVGLLHIPKLRFSDSMRERVDGVAMRSISLGRMSDSPIIVARRNPV